MKKIIVADDKPETRSLSPLLPKKCLFLLIALFLLSGCDFHRKEPRQEAEILGSIEGYNKKIEEVQKSLMKAGFDPGPVDGKMGWKTREAVRNFQKTEKIKVSGFIDTQTWEALSARENPERLSVTVTEQSRKNPKDIKPTLLLKDKQTVTPEIIKLRLRSPNWVKKIQIALRNTGLNPGPIDGKIGPRTRKAIFDFQKLKGLSSNGVIDQKTWEALEKYFPKGKE